MTMFTYQAHHHAGVQPQEGPPGPDQQVIEYSSHHHHAGVQPEEGPLGADQQVLEYSGHYHHAG